MWIRTDENEIINGDMLVSLETSEKERDKEIVTTQIWANIKGNEDSKWIGEILSDKYVGTLVIDLIAREIKHGKELIDITKIMKATIGDCEEDFG